MHPPHGGPLRSFPAAIVETRGVDVLMAGERLDGHQVPAGLELATHARPPSVMVLLCCRVLTGKQRH
jgi:hypothetical protein